MRGLAERSVAKSLSIGLFPVRIPFLVIYIVIQIVILWPGRVPGPSASAAPVRPVEQARYPGTGDDDLEYDLDDDCRKPIRPVICSGIE